MLEVFLILIVIYIAYIVYSDVDDNQQVNKAAKTDIASAKPTVVTAPSKTKVSKNSTAKPQTVVASAKPNTTKAKSSKAKVYKTAAPKIELRTVEMKNPKTGEQAKVANNYRMVKRWIKEALVEEGLLEKIYKTNEMDDAAKAKVAEALSIIKAMDKYKI